MSPAWGAASVETFFRMSVWFGRWGSGHLDFQLRLEGRKCHEENVKGIPVVLICVILMGVRLAAGEWKL